MMACDKSRNM